MGTRVVLTGSELHHLRVRRLQVGGQLILSDGQGSQRQGSVVALDRRRALINLDAGQVVPRDSSLRLVLAQALLKSDKMDLVIEKATELGVSEVLLFDSERSLGRPSAERLARWQRIARSAAKQSQRSTVPLVAAPLSFETILSRTDDLRLLFWERPGGRHLATIADQRRTSEVLVVVGPEGGFGTREADRAVACGFHLCSLGPRVLRAETAALAATTLCQFLWGDFS